MNTIKYDPIDCRLGCRHDGTQAVTVGQYKVLAGGILCRDFDLALDTPGRIVVPLTPLVTWQFGLRYDIIWAPMEDFGGVPDGWREFLESAVVPRLEEGATLLAFCEGGHGRTGTFLASLIALLEDPVKTPDPVAAVRERYCSRAVESDNQIAGILALRPTKTKRKRKGGA